jgi:hypothetical protein
MKKQQTRQRHEDYYAFLSLDRVAQHLQKREPVGGIRKVIGDLVWRLG